MSPHRHRKLRRDLHALVDDEHPGSTTRPALLDHLRACTDCQDELSFLQCLKASLQRIGHRRPAPLAVARLDRWTTDHLRLTGDP